MSLQLDLTIGAAMNIAIVPRTDDKPELFCDCEEWMRTACAGHYYSLHGNTYCLMHHPDKSGRKTEEFNEILRQKLDARDFDFRGVRFPEAVDFRNFEFTAEVNFTNAVFNANVTFIGAKFDNYAHFFGAQFKACAFFNGASFKLAEFTSATFYDQAVFTGSSFSGNALFGNVSFNKNAYFERVIFSKQANFGLASFKANAEFLGTTFGGVALFLYSAFTSYVRFSGSKHLRAFSDNSYLNLQHAQIEKPERVSFHLVTLRPYWFVNVDARRFEFVSVKWSKGRRREIASLRRQVDSSPHHLLSIAYRQLAINAEENHRYREASEFRYWSMNMQRLELLGGESILLRYLGVVKKSTRRVYQSLMRKPGKSVPRRTLIRSWRFLRTYWKSLQVLHWLYWAASGYGERVTRAIVALIALWLLFACAFCLTGFELKPTPTTTAANVISDEVGRPLPITKALTYSLGVMSLQKPEPRPVTTTAQTLVTLETIFGPLQAALLALAIRRKFMR